MTLRVLGSALEVEEAFAPIVPVTVTPPGPGFQMQTGRLELGDGIGILEVRSAPLRARTRKRAIGTGPDVLLFCVHVDGPGRVLQRNPPRTRKRMRRRIRASAVARPLLLPISPSPDP